MRTRRNSNLRRRYSCSPGIQRHRSIWQRRCSTGKSLLKPWSCWKRLPNLRTGILKYLGYSRRLTPASGAGKRRSGLSCGPKHCKTRSSRSEPPADEIQASPGVWWKLLDELLFRRYFIVGLLENLSEDAPSHLLWLLDAVNVQDCRRHVIHAGFQTHQPQIMLDAGTHGEE